LHEGVTEESVATHLLSSAPHTAVHACMQQCLVQVSTVHSSRKHGAFASRKHGAFQQKARCIRQQKAQCISAESTVHSPAERTVHFSRKHGAFASRKHGAFQQKARCIRQQKARCISADSISVVNGVNQKWHRKLRCLNGVYVT